MRVKKKIFDKKLQQPEHFSYRKHSYVNDLEHPWTRKSTLYIIRECRCQSIKMFKNFKVALMTE